MSVYGLVGMGPLVYADETPAGLGVWIGRAARTVWRYDGAGWVSATVSTMGAAEPVEAIAVPSDNPQTVYVLGEDPSGAFTLHRSIDAGAHWLKLASPVAQAEMRQATSIWATTGGTLYLSFCCTEAAAMLWRSDNGGTSWFKIADALISGISDNLYGQEVGRIGFGQTRIWIAGDQDDTGSGVNSTYGFHRYDADGANAVHVAFDNEYYATPQMAAAPDRDDRAWVYWGAIGPDGSVLRVVTPSGSTASGLHGDWTSDGVASVLELGGTTATLVAVARIGPLSSDWALYQSSNGGSSWTKTTATSADFRIPTGSEYAYTLARSPAAPTTELYYVSNTKVHRSTNAGASWSDISSGGPAGGVCIAVGYS